jgi:hypothetical protein
VSSGFLLQSRHQRPHQGLGLLFVWRSGTVTQSLSDHRLGPEQFGSRRLDVQGRYLCQKVGPERGEAPVIGHSKLRLVDRGDDVLRSEPTLANLHLGVDWAQIAGRGKPNLVCSKRQEGRGALCDIRNHQDEPGTATLEDTDSTNGLLTIATGRPQQEMEFTITSFALEVLFQIDYKIKIDYIHCGYETRTRGRLVLADQLLAGITVCVVGVVEGTLLGMDPATVLRCIIAGGGTGRGFCFIHACFCFRASAAS